MASYIYLPVDKTNVVMLISTKYIHYKGCASFVKEFNVANTHTACTINFVTFAIAIGAPY